jgi:N-dimethylarginine dimethylaminohydrolase
LIQNLETRNMTVIPLRLRQSRTLGGGFHCVTLDLVRK